jgi:hypothetical protein
MTARSAPLALPALLAALAAGCGGGHQAPVTTSAAAAPAAAVTVSADEQPACRLLYARLQRVTIALQTSSELIAHSLDQQQLSRRIGIEQVQLERSARLLTGGPVPDALVTTDRDLVAALHAFSRDFSRAKASAAGGDFHAATAAMADTPVVQRILAAAKTIQTACGG